MTRHKAATVFIAKKEKFERALIVNDKSCWSNMPMKKIRYRRDGTGSHAGFTILELIVSITILTLVALIIGNAFRIGVNAWDKGEAETIETQRLRILSSMLSQQIKSAVKYEVNIDEEESDTLLFEGKKDSVLFVTALADAPFGGMKWVRYLFKEGVLYYKEGLLPDKNIEDSLEGDEEILDTDLGEVVFEYIGGDEEEWSESWEMSNALPQAVRVKISYFQPFQVNLKAGSTVQREKEI